MGNFENCDLTIPTSRPNKDDIYSGIVGALSNEMLRMLDPGINDTEESDRRWAKQDGSTYYEDPLAELLKESETLIPRGEN